MIGAVPVLVGPKPSPLRAAMQREHGPEAKALLELIADEPHEAIVLDVYLAALAERRAQLARAEPAETFVVEAGPRTVKITEAHWMVETRAVAEAHGLSVADLIGPLGPCHAARVRWALWFRLFCERLPDGGRRYSLSQLGRLFRTDRANVRHGMRQYCAKNGIDPAVLA